jgi:acyl-CoA synthetase (AMP-forming)/AMP-acid ligase II
MNIAMLLEMAADGLGDRVAFGRRQGGITYADLLTRSRQAAAALAADPGERVALVDVNSEAIPIALFGAGLAGKPFTPINYRLADAQLQAILERTAPGLAIVDASVPPRVAPVRGLSLVPRSEFLERVAASPADATDWGASGESIAVLLFTSGTTGEPKAAVLRHRHLVSYIISTVEFMGADEDEAALVSVPPYHVAGMTAVLSSVYVGRRVLYLESFDPAGWVATAREERITHAMVVPTMLERILDVIEGEGAASEGLPTLRHLSYGAGRMPLVTIERALRLLPTVDLVNAYGLTETSSTIAVLTPDDHREAAASAEPEVRARLGSVGRPMPTIELEIRDADSQVLPAGVSGEIWVRGEQVSGEYLGRTATLDDGWFPTKDAGYVDQEGYLFIEGRLDDVIVRGGENLSPGEIEEVLRTHPAVVDAGVFGIPDAEWGEVPVACVVLSEGADATETILQAWVRERLRSSRTPARVEIRAELPYTETGKLLRRVLKAELLESRQS